MPIFDPTSSDPTLYNIYLDDLTDVVVPAPLDGMILGWTDASGWVAIPFSAITGSQSLGGLTDITISSESAGQSLIYNGAQWVNSGVHIINISDFPTPDSSGQALIWDGINYIFGTPTGINSSGVGGSSTLLGLDDVSVVGNNSNQGLIYQSDVGKYVNTSVIFAPTGLSLDTSVNNATIINNAVNGYGYCYIPSGTYYISSLINLVKSNTKLFGPGILKAASTFAGSQMIYVGGSGCVVEDLTLDGSDILDPDIIGINMRGYASSLINVTISGSTDHGINLASNYGLVDKCKLLHCARSGGDAIDAIGLVNYIKNTYIYGYGTKGIGGDTPYRTATDKAYLYIDNCYIVPKTGVYQTRRPTVFGEGILIDPGTGTMGYDAVYITNTIVDHTDFQTNTDTQPVKVAIADSLYIDGCSFVTSITGEEITCGLRVAERVGQLVITNSTISPGILYETNTLGDRISETLVIENSRIGNSSAPFWRGRIPLEDIRARYIRINGCSIHNSGTTRMIRTDWDGVQRIEVTNNRLIANHSSAVGAIAMTTGDLGLEYSSRKLYWYNNYIANSGSSTIVAGTNPPELLLSSTKNTEGSWYTANSPLNPTGISQFSRITFQKDDRITHTGDLSIGQTLDWVCSVGGKPGTWVPYSKVLNPTGNYLTELNDVNITNSGVGTILEPIAGKWTPTNTLNSLKQSYLTGIYDITYYGVTNTGAIVNIEIQNFINSLPNNAKVRIPAGIYRINDSIKIYNKHGVNIDATNATFLETRRLASGIFLYSGSTNCSWNGGEFSGADTLAFIMGFASGVEFSGLGIESYGPGNDAGESPRYVLGQAFDTNLCSGITISNIYVHDKYRAVTDNNSRDITYFNINHIGVHSGSMFRGDETIVYGITGVGAGNTGTATAIQGAIWKETARTTYSITVNKTNRLLVTNCRAKLTGGLLVAGSNSLGGGGGNPQFLTIDNCYGHNLYDNGIYLSSCNKASVTNTKIICDTSYPHSIEGMKGRGNNIIFQNCYVEHAAIGFGIEGFQNTADYWTNGGSQGWTSEGCRIINCTARDIGNYGIFLDRNNNIYPRDTLIAYNYLYDCAKGPYGRIPSGFLSDHDGQPIPFIRATDGFRCRIIGNIIEQTGVIGPDYAIYVGAYYFGGYISGCQVTDNIILGAKQGIYLNNIANARIANNYGQRIGYYTSPYTHGSGYPALIVCNNVRDTRIVDNQLAPTGHAAFLYVNPDTEFANVLRRDNDGYEVIN